MKKPFALGKLTIKVNGKHIKVVNVIVYKNVEKLNEKSPDFYGIVESLETGRKEHLGLWLR